MYYFLCKTRCCMRRRKSGLHIKSDEFTFCHGILALYTNFVGGRKMLHLGKVCTAIVQIDKIKTKFL